MDEDSVLRLRDEISGIKSTVEKVTQGYFLLNKEELVEILGSILESKLRETEKISLMVSMKNILLTFGVLGISIALFTVVLILFTEPI